MKGFVVHIKLLFKWTRFWKDETYSGLQWLKTLKFARGCEKWQKHDNVQHLPADELHYHQTLTVLKNHKYLDMNSFNNLKGAADINIETKNIWMIREWEYKTRVDSLHICVLHFFHWMTIDDAQLFSSLKLKSSNMLTELPKCDHQLLRKKAIAAGTLARDFTVAFAIQYPLDVVQTRLQGSFSISIFHITHFTLEYSIFSTITWWFRS